MGRVGARIDVPGQASDAEALWYDVGRWPTFVDGLKHIARVTGDWPHPGAEVVWDSQPGGRGRGRVLEQVVAYEPRRGQDVALEDERIRATQRIGFAPHADGVAVTLELDYELKERTPVTRIVDLLFVRREVEASLRRTLAGFARERRGDLEWEATESR